MRTATLAALALASACGSSSPEVAPPPAPAPAAAVPRASIAATEQYYDIDGASTGALRDQVNRPGPKDESGKSRDALTAWSIEWHYRATSRRDGCVRCDGKVSVNVGVTLPRWKPSAAGAP